MQGPIVVSGFVMSIIVLSQLWDILASIFVLNVNAAEVLGWCGDNFDEGIASIKIDSMKLALAKQNSFAFLTTQEFVSLLLPYPPFFNLDCRAQFLLHQHSFIVNICHHCTIKPLQ